MIYGVRFKKKRGDAWRRSRTLTNPLGRWREGGANYIVNKLKRRGYLAHKFPIIVYPNKTHYSPNYSRKELDCKCGCTTPRSIQANLAALARNLELMRRAYGNPIPVISGYRCPAYNKRIGGASRSQHMQGRAADLASSPIKQSALIRAARKVPAFARGGIGEYPAGGVHVDIRPNGPAYWTSF